MLHALAVYAGDEKPYAHEMDRLTELEPLVGESVLTLNGDYGFVLAAHRRYNEHGRYPFGSGGWSEQPQWLLDDFRSVDLYIEFCELRRKLTIKVNDVKRPKWLQQSG